MNDIFDDLFGPEELEEMYAHVTSFVEDEHIHESLVSQPNPPSFEHALVTAKLAPVPVKDHLTRKLMTLSNSLPRGCEILLHEEPDSPINTQLDDLVRKVRQRYMPHIVFSKCAVLRGHFGSRAPVLAQGGQSYVLFWRKNDPQNSFTS